MIGNLPIGAFENVAPLDPLAQQLNKGFDLIKKQNTADLTVALQSPPEVISSILEAGDTSPINEAKASVGNPTMSALEYSFTQGIDSNMAAQNLQETQEKFSDFQADPRFYIEGALTVGDPNYNPALSRLLTNQQIAYEVFKERFKETEDQGWFATIGDFADYALRSLTIGTYEAIVRRNETKGREIAQAAVNMSPTEFREYISKYAQEVAEQGIFSEENYFSYLEGLFEAENAGYDPFADVNQVLAIGGLVEVGVAARSALRTGSAVSRAGAVGGAEAADNAATRLSDTVLRNDPNVQNDILPSALSPTANPQIARPNQVNVSQIIQSNPLIQEIKTLHQNGAFAPMATPEQVDLLAQSVVEDIRRVSNRNVVDYGVTEDIGIGDNVLEITFGKKSDGLPYKDKNDAVKYSQSLQQQGLSAEVTPAQGGGYYVKVRERLDTTQGADAIDVAREATNLFNRTIGQFIWSTGTTDTIELNTLANMSEAGMTAIRELTAPYLKSIEAIGLDSKFTIAKVLRELKDGSDAAYRSWYTDIEFKQKFKLNHPKGLDPADKDMEAFYALKTMSDASYILQANRVGMRYVSRGFKTINVTGTGTTPARIVSDVPESAVIVDGGTGVRLSRADVPEDTLIWKTDMELEGGIEYVTNPTSVREIMPEDILGYNAGGPRNYRNTNYFVTIGDRAFLSAFTDSQAKTAVSQFSQIVDSFKSFGTPLESLTDELDDVISNNNSWNLDIGDTSDFVRWAKDNNIDLDGTVSYKGKDQIVDGDDLFGGMKAGDYFSVRHRSDRVLTEFGGGKADTYNPIASIVDQLSSAAAQYSHAAYNYRSKVSWLKAAGYDKALGTDSIENLWEASKEIADKLSGEKGRTLRRLRDVIDRRDGVEGRFSMIMSDMGKTTAEFIFEKSGKKVNLGELDVTGSLLNLAYRSSFGFFNVSQFMVQSAHVPIIVAASPIQGFKAAAAMFPMRLVMNAKGKFKDIGIKRLSQFFGISEEDVRELETYLRTSGRLLVESDAIEKNTGPAWGYTSFEGHDMRPGVVRKTMNQVARVGGTIDRAGLLAFREGEKMPRYTAMITSFLEWKKANPGKSALNAQARMALTQREQALTFQMTTSSRAMWQTGQMRVPTQWLSYSMRALENIAVGREFTKGERIRMLGTYVAMGGAVGIPAAGWIADTLGDKWSMDPTSPEYTALRYGFVDGLLTWGLQEATDSDIQTALGSRLAPLTAFTDFYNKLTQESAVVAIGGPSAEIVGGGVMAFFKTVGHLANGNYESSLSDLERVVRTPTGIDNFVKARQIMEYGTYTSKTGTPNELRFSEREALLQAAGITNFRTADYYRENTGIFKDQKKFKARRKEFDNEFSRALKLWEEDQERGRALMYEIEARIKLSGLTPYEQYQIRKSIINSSQGKIFEMAITQLRKDNQFGFERIDTMKEPR